MGCSQGAPPMKETGQVVNPEAFPCPPREVGEAEPVLSLPPGAMRRWHDSGGPAIPTTLVQRAWWLIMSIYRELAILGKCLLPTTMHAGRTSCTPACIIDVRRPGTQSHGTIGSIRFHSPVTAHGCQTRVLLLQCGLSIGGSVTTRPWCLSQTGAPPMEDEAPSPLPLYQEVAALRQRVAQL